MDVFCDETGCSRKFHLIRRYPSLLVHFVHPLLVSLGIAFNTTSWGTVCVNCVAPIQIVCFGRPYPSNWPIFPCSCSLLRFCFAYDVISSTMSKQSVESRLRSLESVCNNVNQQVSATKRLLESKIADMQKALDAQVDEIKQIIMQQDRVYRERIRRLDLRIEQLSEFALKLARKNATNIGGLGFVEGLPEPPPPPTLEQGTMHVDSKKGETKAHSTPQQENKKANQPPQLEIAPLSYLTPTKSSSMQREEYTVSNPNVQLTEVSMCAHISRK